MRRILLATCAAIACGGAAFAAPVGGTGDVTPDIIFGSGNANGSFTGAQANGLELGLRGKLRYNNSGVPENTFNYDGDKTYEFETTDGVAPANRSLFNFEWSINSDFDGNGANLDAYDYLIGVDTNPSVFTNFTFYDPLSTFSTGAYFGTNANGNGGAPFTAAGQAQSVYDDLAAANNVAQNSVNLGFLGLFADPQLQGLFTISLLAFDAGTQDLAGSTEIHVRYGEVAPVPVPAALPLLAGGLMALYGIRRRRKPLA